MEPYEDVLKRCPLFRGIPQEALGALLACLGARPRRFARGETILAEGDPARWVGVVLCGAVQILRVDYYGNRSIVDRAGPAEMFAEAVACAGAAAMPVDAVAAEASEILLLDAQRLTRGCAKACGAHSQVISNLILVLAIRNLQCIQKLEITSQRSAREKLMAYLLMQAKRSGSAAFEIPYDRQELADYLGVDRSGLSAQISLLRREGVIECRKNRFVLLGGR